MGNELLFAGIVVVSFLILYIITKFNTEEKWLNFSIQMFGVGLVVILMVLLPKVVLDDNDYCTIVAENATTSGSTTSYDYKRLCFDNTTSTATSFYKATLWFFRVLLGFLGIYFIVRTIMILNSKNWRFK